MKILEVQGLQSGIDYTIKDIKTVRNQIEAIQRAVRDFHYLEDDLKGQGGEAIRAFYKDTHEPFLIFLHQSLIDYDNLLLEMKEAIDSFEYHDSGYISQEFIEGEIEEGFDKVETQTMELTEEANRIVGSVSEFVSIPRIDESEVMEDIRHGKEKAQEIVEELAILDNFETSQLESTKQDLQTMRSFLSDMESKFKSGDLSIANYDVESIQDMTAYQTMMDDIYNQGGETISAAYGDNIDEMPLSEIEKMHENQLENLNQNSKDALNAALYELKSGNMDRQQYLTVMQGLPLYEKAVKEAKGPEDLSFNQLPESVQTMLKTTGDVSSQALTESMKQLGIVTGEFGIAVKSFPYFKKVFGTIGKGIVKGGKFLHGVGTVAGYGTMAAGFGLGMYEDMSIKNKTAGEAVAHNATSLGIGISGNMIGTAVTAKVLTAAAFSGPVGLAAVGIGILVGTAATYAFNKLYDNNIFNLQGELDDIGQKLEQAGREAKEMGSNLIENTGQAIKSGGIQLHQRIGFGVE